MTSRREDFFSLVEKYRYTGKPLNYIADSTAAPLMAFHKHYRSSSKVERYVIDYIREKGLRFDREKSFPTLAEDKPLRFDFYLLDYKLLVEVDGEQHYRGTMFHRTREEWMKQVNHDEMKNRYCRDNRIHLLRIPTTCSSEETHCLLERAIASILDGQQVYQVDAYFQKKAGKKIT